MEYNPEVLRKLQMLQVGILKDFDQLCRQYDLTYFVGYGTAIGAVRHQGFIPWDDDIDVCMPRKDYERFLEIASKKLQKKYKILNAFTEEKFVMMFSKMCLADTVFIEEANKDIKYKQGIFLDIFPYDKTVKDKKQREKQLKMCRFWGRMMIMYEHAVPKMPEGYTGLKRMIIMMGCAGIHFLLHVCGFTKLKLYDKRQAWACKYENQQTGAYIDLSPYGPERTIVYEEEILPAKEMMFEGIKVKLLHGYDRHLRACYGNYMQMPPIDQRINHSPSFLDFGPYGPSEFESKQKDSDVEYGCMMCE